MPITLPLMQDEIDTDPTLAAVETFLTESGMTPTAFGVQALNDPTLVPELRKGRECKRATRARIMDFIQSESARRRAA